MRSTGAEIVKIAIEAQRARRRAAADGPRRRPELATPDGMNGHVLMAMGQPGVPSRVLAARLGNRWTYAGDGVAPGQMPAARLLGEFRFRRIRPDAALYGVVGNPIAHSLSPVMHNAGFARARAERGLRAARRRADADDFVAFARGPKHARARASPRRSRSRCWRRSTRSTRWRGASAPSTRSSCATGAGSARTPTSTDSSRRSPGRMALKGTRASVLGAGRRGARASPSRSATQGAAVTVCARQRRGRARGRRAGRRQRRRVAAAAGQLGRARQRHVVRQRRAAATNPMDGVPLDGEIVFDLVYAPAETPLLAERARGRAA